MKLIKHDSDVWHIIATASNYSIVFIVTFCDEGFEKNIKDQILTISNYNRAPEFVCPTCAEFYTNKKSRKFVDKFHPHTEESKLVDSFKFEDMYDGYKNRII